MIDPNGIALPRDTNNDMVPLMPTKIALASTYSTNTASTLPITFNTATRMIEVTALLQPIFVRWGVSNAASTTNFDYIVPAGMTRNWFIALDLTNQTPGAIYTGANFLAQTSGGILCLSEF